MGAGAKAELDDASSGEESVMVLSLLESSELESEAYTLAVFSLSISSDPPMLPLLCWRWRGDGLSPLPLLGGTDDFWCSFLFMSAAMEGGTGFRLSTLLRNFSALWGSKTQSHDHCS